MAYMMVDSGDTGHFEGFISSMVIGSGSNYGAAVVGIDQKIV